MTEHVKDYKGISPEKLDTDSSFSANEPSVDSSQTNTREGSLKNNIIESNNKICIKMNFKDKFNSNTAKILLLIGNSGNIIKLECFTTYVSKRVDTQLNIYEPWETFLTNMENLINTDNDPKYEETSKKLKVHLFQILKTDYLNNLSSKIKPSTDQNMRNLIAKEALTKPLTDFFKTPEYEFDVFVDPDTENSADNTSNSNDQAFPESSALDSDKQLSFINIAPVIDPVKGSRADSLSIGESIYIRNHEAAAEISAVIADIIPSKVDKRLLIYVTLEDNVMGKLVVSENTLIKTGSEAINEEMDDDIIKFVVIAAVIVIILIVIMIYIL